MIRYSAAQLVQRAREAAVDGLTDSAQRVRAVAVPRTPLDEGDLRSSLEVVDADINQPKLVSGVVSNSPYAVRQHEDMDLNHPGGGEAKFLENAAIDARREVAVLMAKRAKKEIGGR